MESRTLGIQNKRNLKNQPFQIETGQKATERYLLEKKNRDFPAGLLARTLCSQFRGPRFDPWVGNWIPYAATKSLTATTKDPARHN